MPNICRSTSSFYTCQNNWACSYRYDLRTYKFLYNTQYIVLVCTPCTQKSQYVDLNLFILQICIFVCSSNGKAFSNGNWQTCDIYTSMLTCGKFSEIFLTLQKYEFRSSSLELGLQRPLSRKKKAPLSVQSRCLEKPKWKTKWQD